MLNVLVNDTSLKDSFGDEENCKIGESESVKWCLWNISSWESEIFTKDCRNVKFGWVCCLIWIYLMWVDDIVLRKREIDVC